MAGQRHGVWQRLQPCTPGVGARRARARVGVLRGEGGAEHLESHARRGLDDRRVVAEPPAAVDVQAAKLAREHGELVLVVIREHGEEQLDLRQGMAS